METWAITGASGFVGTELIRQLKKDGIAVRAFVRSGNLPGVENIVWNATRPGDWMNAIDGVDVVVHLAGAPIGDKRWTDERKREILASRVDAGKLISRAMTAASRKPRVYLSASAVGAYGAREDDMLCTEETPFASDFLGSVCRAWEESADGAREAGIRTIHPRLGVVIGKGGGVYGKLAPLFRAALGGPVGSGRQWMPWISLEDTVRALRFLADSSLAGPVNLVAPTPVTMNEFAKVFGQVLSRPALFRAPGFAVKLALGEMSAIILGGQRAVPEVLTKAGFRFEHPTLEAALRAAH